MDDGMVAVDEVGRWRYNEATGKIINSRGQALALRIGSGSEVVAVPQQQGDAFSLRQQPYGMYVKRSEERETDVIA